MLKFAQTLPVALITLTIGCQGQKAIKTTLHINSPGASSTDLVTYEQGDKMRLETSIKMQVPGGGDKTIENLTLSNAQDPMVHSRDENGEWKTLPKPSLEERTKQAEQGGLILGILEKGLAETETQLKDKKIKAADKLEAQKMVHFIKAQRFAVRRGFSELARSKESVDQVFLPTEQRGTSVLGECQIHTSAVQSSLKDEHCVVAVEKTPWTQKEFQERTEKQLKETPFNSVLLLAKNLDYKYLPVWTKGYENGELMLEIEVRGIEKVDVKKDFFSAPKSGGDKK